MIAANRGMLPEIVENNREGLIIDDRPENLADAIMTLVENPGIRQAMGQNALEKAREEFDLETQAKKIEQIYQEVKRH